MKKNKLLLSIILSFSMMIPCSIVSFADSAKLKILSTTDIHTAFNDYNYYTDTKDEKSGLVRIATIIKEQRKEAGKKNTLLLDNGDFIQGTPLGDYLARVKKLKKGETYLGVEILNYLKYDAATLGNHEFNYGLPYLKNVLKNANYPYVSSNVLTYGKKKPFIKPYVILNRKIKTTDGNEKTIKIGIIGAVAPQITTWDSANLDKKIISKDIVSQIKKYVPEMKKKGADIIIALSHSGMGEEKAENMGENVSYQVSKIKGIDLIIAGHSHKAFPADNYKEIKNVDIEKGTVNEKPFNISGSYADALGVTDITISNDDGKWKIIDSTTKNIPVYDKEKQKSVPADKEVKKILEKDHKNVLKYIRSSIGTTKSPITSFFALSQDDSSIQLINNAQIWYAKEKIKGTKYENLPVLSAAAPFKAGGRGGADYYTNIPEGTLAIKNMADLYVYPNTLYILKITGKDLREWLERSAGQFNKIDPTKNEKQMLINNEFPTYNFDVIDGVTYKIDITQDSKYDRDGKLINPDAKRIVDLMHNGKDVQDNQEFLIVTNNYRAGGGGNFPNININRSVFASPDENRQVVMDYIMKNKEIDPKADENWSFVPIKNNKATIIVSSSPKAKNMTGEKYKLDNIDETTGFANYILNLK